MLQTIKATVERYNMFSGVEEVTVALSGGADSVALLSAMLKLSDEYGFKVYAAHLNHSLRADESDEDERFVRKLCEKLGVPLFCEKADVNGFAESKKLSIEFAARQIRYEFLNRVAKGCVATAHTANDNIETVLYNMARGTGLSGLCGIPPKRDIFIRPLIEVERCEIEEYCRENGLQYRIDSTNADVHYKRNFIRHNIVPKILEVNSSAVKNVQQMSKTLRDDKEALYLLAVKSYNDALVDGGLAKEKLNQLHSAIRSRCIMMLFESVADKCLEYKNVEAVTELLKLDFGKVSVVGDYSAVLKNGVLKFVPSKNCRLPMQTVTNFPFCDLGLKISKLSIEKFKNILKFNNLLLNNALDYDKICGKIVLRGRKPSDKIRLKGRNCTKSLKKLLNEAKTDEYIRDAIPLISDDNGVVWLYGFGVDESVAVDDLTKTVILIENEG